jgi:hypothetical protein
VTTLTPVAYGSLVVDAWRGAMHLAADMAWKTYADRELLPQRPELSVDARRALVQRLRRAKMSEQAVAWALGCSKKTVHNDRVFLDDDEEPAIVLSVDNRRVASNTGRTVQPLIELLSLEVEEKMSSDERAAVLTRAAGSHGMTVKELCDMTGWNQCRAAAALSRAHRKRGWLTCSGEFRESCGAYVATEYWSTDRVRELLARFESEAPVEAEVFNLDDAPALIG